jgi:hypothetical protein
MPAEHVTGAHACGGHFGLAALLKEEAPEIPPMLDRVPLPAIEQGAAQHSVDCGENLIAPELTHELAEAGLALGEQLRMQDVSKIAALYLSKISRRALFPARNVRSGTFGSVA